jgi:outer membrane receptor protein involved in Fe transport
LLRQAPTASSRDPGPGTDAERANALGTSLVLDGVPLSNNANLQTTLTILNSGPAALPQFASSAGRGLDLRQFAADNVESVEVIRGIPSARHGDLTAGAILVTSRAGAQRPELRVRANPLTFEASTVAGWGSGARGLSLGALIALRGRWR